ncbi:MAG: YtxH domain-containing protein [Prolixibacteraceae bacterium]|jgi:gas vesicle protein
MSSGKVLLGVLVGATAGALAGILFAPHKGTVTRKKIIRTSGAFADGVKEKFDELLEDITEKFDKVKSEITDFTEKKVDKSVDTKDAKNVRN